MFTISATFTNISSTDYSDPFFEVTELSPGNKKVLNCDGGPQGVGCQVSAMYDTLGPDELLSPGESFTVDFEIGLDVREQFTFFVDAFGVVD